MNTVWANRPRAMVTMEPYRPSEKVANERPKNAPTGGWGHGPRAGRANQKAINFVPSLKRLIYQLAPDKIQVIAAIAMGVIGVAFNVVNPKILGKATDVIFGGAMGTTIPDIYRRMAGQPLPPGTTKAQIIEMLNKAGQTQYVDMLQSLNFTPGVGIDFTRLSRVLLICLALYVTANVLTFLQGYVLNWAVQRLVYRLRDQVSDKIDRLPLSFFDRQPRGELLSRVTNDIDNVQQTLQQTLGQLINSVLMLLGVLVMMFTISWELALISIVVIPISALIAALVGKQSQKRFAQMWESTGELNGQVEEAFTGHALVKVFGRRQEALGFFNKTNETLYKSSFGAQFISGIIMPLVIFIGNLNYVAVAVIGGLKVAHGTMNLGDVQAFIQYSRQFSQPVSQVASMANLLQSGVASAERVFEVLDATEQAQDNHASLPAPIRGHVKFDSVEFRYVHDRPLITNLNLEAKPGRQIAIVGPTGAGKTTLVNLLERFYEIQDGVITLDGIDITSVPRHELRDKIGMVLQDTWLFSGTIYDNIAYGKQGATKDEVMAAAHTAYVDRFAHTLPDGYQTVIDEEGSNISAGEKQLLTIARAFISDPSILILDEATSSVDTRTELLVQQAMAKLRQGRTSFVIAHRLSTIRDADSILVMQHGDIVEQGTHDELLAAKGAYYDLYQSQFNAADSDENDPGVQPEWAAPASPEQHTRAAQQDSAEGIEFAALAVEVPTRPRRSLDAEPADANPTHADPVTADPLITDSAQGQIHPA